MSKSKKEPQEFHPGVLTQHKLLSLQFLVYGVIPDKVLFSVGDALFQGNPGIRQEIAAETVHIVVGGPLAHVRADKVQESFNVHVVGLAANGFRHPGESGVVVVTRGIGFVRALHLPLVVKTELQVLGFHLGLLMNIKITFRVGRKVAYWATITYVLNQNNTIMIPFRFHFYILTPQTGADYAASSL